MKNNEYFSAEFYAALAAVIKECEAHPFATTRPYDDGDGWEYRVSKKNLGGWDSSEQYDAIEEGKDEKVNQLCAKSTLDCNVLCDKGGYTYLIFS